MKTTKHSGRLSDLRRIRAAHRELALIGATLLLSINAFSNSANAGQVLLYAHDSTRHLYTIDVATGNAALLSTTPEIYTDIAFNSKGQLYGITNGGRLRLIDPATGLTSLVGDTGYTPNSLVFAPDGTLWGAGIGGNVITIDPATGDGNLVMTLSPYSAAGDLAFDFLGNLLVTTTQSELLRLDFSAQPPSYSVLGDTGLNNIFGMARGPDGTMFGVTESNQLLTLDPQNGTVLSNLAIAADFDLASTFGTSFTTEVVPEPACMCLLCAGIGCLLARRGRAL